MIPMRTSTVFKNRWMALVWAAGIIWFAYDFAGSQPGAGNSAANADQPTTDASGAPLTADDQQRASDAINAF